MIASSMFAIVVAGIVASLLLKANPACVIPESTHELNKLVHLHLQFGKALAHLNDTAGEQRSRFRCRHCRTETSNRGVHA